MLSRLHRYRRPATYLEIGTETGRTLEMARCASIAIDPEFRLDRDVKAGKPSCGLYEMTSDAFFASHDPTALLGAPIDFAFIDGMHRYEFALRDFMNVERHCRPNSIIVLHDCLPVDTHMARVDQRDRQFAARAEHEVGWAGDTWKAIWILRRYRPDLRLFAFDAPPSGLVVVTNLDSTSTVLRDRYDEAVKAALDVSLAGYYAELEILPTSAIRRPVGFAETPGQVSPIRLRPVCARLAARRSTQITFPGLRIPFGSSAALIRRITVDLRRRAAVAEIVALQGADAVLGGDAAADPAHLAIDDLVHLVRDLLHRAAGPGGQVDVAVADMAVDEEQPLRPARDQRRLQPLRRARPAARSAR